MEVLMGRSRTTRLSRGLIGILAITIVLGSIFYFHNVNKTKAADKDKGAVTTVAMAEKTDKPAKKHHEDKAAVAESGAKAEVISAPPIVAMGPTTAPTTSAPPTTKSATQPSQQSTSLAKAKPTGPISSAPLVDAKARQDAGDLLNARRILNASLVAGKFSDAEAQQAKAMLNQINATVVFSPKRFADDEYGGTYSVQPGELLQKIAAMHNITWQYLCRVNGLSDPKKLRAGATIKVLNGPFHALVEKKKFNMEIWVGGEPYTSGACYVTSFGVGLGKDDSTPTGKWLVQQGNKIKNPTYYSPRGEGVIEAGDPKNPLGQYWMGLVGVDGHAVGKMSYGIHGTIDPDSIGKQESMGCIRMRNEDVAQVFELLVEGKSTVTVRD
jgi:lipoprotein-anchoring transpeptidase ErfK/SrfK